MINIYTDGACSGNPGPGGYAVVFLYDNEDRNYSLTGGEKETTNNRMELTAILTALREMDNQSGNFFQENFTIYSDSAYCVNMCNDWIKGWANNGWTRGKKKEPILNLDIIQQIYNLLVKLDGRYEIIKVQGHFGNKGNEYADKLAVAAKNKVMKESV